MLAVLAAVTVVAVLESYAQSRHRARLSRDLVDRLTAVESSTGIIVSASDDSIDQLVALRRRLTKRIHWRRDQATGGRSTRSGSRRRHIAGDSTVYRMMAVTTQATGADQVWDGVEGLRGLTGSGIGIAVIDSGVAPHSALRTHVVASVDFTDPKGLGRDAFGHGTHIAGIIGEGDRDGHGGMAPGAWIVNLRVLGADGSGKSSDVIDAIDWAIRTQLFNIGSTCARHPLFSVSRRSAPGGGCRHAGILVGRRGEFQEDDGRRPIVGYDSPGNTPSVCVRTDARQAALDDIMATYSSRGPTAIDGVLKPAGGAGQQDYGGAGRGSYLGRTYPGASSTAGHAATTSTGRACRPGNLGRGSSMLSASLTPLSAALQWRLPGGALIGAPGA